MSVVSGYERMRAAALRAVAGDARAELRGVRLRIGHRAIHVSSPFVGLTSVEDPVVSRGLADALAMVVRHSDPSVHRELAPADPIERVVFDALEQLRCLSLAPDLPGVQANLGAVIKAWCHQARADGVGESGVGLLIYTTIHMVRARLGLGLTDEAVDSVIEGARARLGRLLGGGLAELARRVTDQAGFAVVSAEIARLVAEMAADTSRDADGLDPARFRMLAPESLNGFDGGAEQEPAPTSTGSMAVGDGRRDLASANLDTVGGYRVFTRQHDVEVDGTELYGPRRLRRARRELDDRLRAQAVSPQRLAARLRHIFGAPIDDGWRSGLPEGHLDRRRLAQLVTTVDPQTLFRQQRPVVQPTTALTLLVDQSGSMKSHRHLALAMVVDTLSRALDLAGVTNEVLGYTTASWAGGAALAGWKRAGRELDPGRAADLCHVVYKSADGPWRRARRSLAAMTVTDHFRESVDGEAVVWARRRLMVRPEQRKVLIVVSDGAPAEAGTALATGDFSYLVAHLAHVVAAIERAGEIEIAALSIGGSVETVFSKSIRLDLDSTPSSAEYRSLETLFG